ncbi:LysR family transcriptional regulator [Paenibacillus sp. strain BS8-2]
MTINLEQLQHLVETARHQSLSQAAVTLHISQSGLSQSIASLEKDLGVTLFTRSRMGAILTPEGRTMVHKAMQILTLMQEMKDEAKLQAELLSGNISIASFPGTVHAFIRISAQLKSEYQNIFINIREASSMQMIKELEDGHIDAAFVVMTEELLEEHGVLVFNPVRTGRIVVCVGKDTPMAQQNSITPEQLKETPLVLYDDDLVHWFVRDFERKYGALEVLFTTNNSFSIAMALSEGHGITVGHDLSFYDLPRFLGEDFVPVELKGVDTEPVQFGWLTRNRVQPPLLKEFMVRFEKEMSNRF